jgi:hypothetical protein
VIQDPIAVRGQSLLIVLLDLMPKDLEGRGKIAKRSPEITEDLALRKLSSKLVEVVQLVPSLPIDEVGDVEVLLETDAKTSSRSDLLRPPGVRS